MRTLTITVCCALLAGMAHAGCVAPDPKESSSHVRIVVLLDGKPLKGVKVDFYPATSQSGFSELLTNGDGSANPSALAPGDYNVVATLHEVMSTTLWLHVVRDGGTTNFSMDFTDPVKRVEKLPVNDHLKSFQGIVSDPSGAVIRADILVVKKGSQVQDIVFATKADSNGHFSEQLDEGSYIAFFFGQGFRVSIVPFEVTKNGSGDLKVMLTIGHC